ncbi:beta-glucosidase [Lacticaseibacillus camelliae DSM 22697 = JCM 13995]|uniref:Beta-glucosidase n=1 Tax=Lacticaseibacillus camelliae DSM 22697 = JCM 13995 TaxID=1423730 RepID=A0A0R2EV35_9LACO|nr:beta-glucosidase [Lacticaseibacillus camelliae DSM 22697 = JCM 13995]
MTITIGSGATRRELSDQDAIKLTSGQDFWSSENVAGIPAIRMSDGPHGLRYQAQASDHLGINEAVPATAFPTASASASSWDPRLLVKMGAAIGEEARSMNVDVVLGPGVNIKRNPLGGRNFEFFSEDPLLTGALATAWINGLQSKGVGASLKHFAGNSQETDRLRSDSLIDATALHELYLEAFRLAVTQSQPETVMIAYNLLNGTYMSDHEYLLNTVLRGQWGFKGAVVSDWGALNDKVKSLNAGTDLEMPSSGHLFDKPALAALKTGQLDRARLTRAVANIAAIADRKRPAFTGDRDALLQSHVALAQNIEENSAVLMKNDGTLPLQPGRKLAVIGALADQTRIQGAGSSHITTPQSISILAGLKAAGHEFAYVAGYTLDGQADPALVKAAVATAKKAEDVIVVLGLPATAEATGHPWRCRPTKSRCCTPWRRPTRMSWSCWWRAPWSPPTGRRTPRPCSTCSSVVKPSGPPRNACCSARCRPLAN